MQYVSGGPGSGKSSFTKRYAHHRTASQFCAAYLFGARLVGAKLRDANLRDADLCVADLSGADLTGADPSGAVVRHAHLTRARYNTATKPADIHEYLDQHGARREPDYDKP